MANFISLLLILCSWITVSSASLLYWIWLRPWQRRRLYERQGIRGPAFRPILGNHKEKMAAVKETAPPNPVPLTQLTAQTVLPDLYSFCRNYGNVNVHEVLWTTFLTVAEPALVKEVLATKASYYQKAPIIRTLILSVLGRGLVFAEGNFWREQRKIYNPAFHKTFLKGLFHHMRQCCNEVAGRWRSKIEEQGGSHAEVEASVDMSTITLDIIARSAFGASIPGSAPTSQGVQAFQNIVPLFTGNLRKLFTIVPLIPGYRFLPTADNRKNWERERFINGMLEEIIEARLKAIAQRQASDASLEDTEHPYGHDLLGMMVAAWKSGSSTMSRKQILSECKTIFVAGHSTTALGLTWALFLLAVHPEWQERLREEIEQVVGGVGGELSVDSFGKLVQMDMFMKEVYRLYPPVTIVYRQCQRTHRIGNILVAAGTVLAIPIAMMHQSKEQWGQDADVFRPERWQDKSGGVKDPMATAFCTFGAGPRQCLGREFALMETFAMLSTLLPQFDLSLAPSYRHAPGQMQSIRPVYGMQLQVKLRQSS